MPLPLVVVQALCAQMIGQACTSLFKCCEKSGALEEWVQSYAFGGGVPLAKAKTSLTPTPKEAFPHPLVRGWGGGGGE